MHDMPESNACVLCLRYLLTICLPPIQKSWVFSRGIYLYGWNIACVLTCPSIIHSFRTDENYVMGRDSVVSCMLVMYIDNFCTFVIHNQPRRNCGLEFTFLLYGARFLLAGENVNKRRDRSQEARGSNHSMHPSSPLRAVPVLHNKLSPARHGFTSDSRAPLAAVLSCCHGGKRISNRLAHSMLKNNFKLQDVVFSDILFYKSKCLAKSKYIEKKTSYNLGPI